MTTGQSSNRGIVKDESSPSDIVSDSAPRIPMKTLNEQFNRMIFLTNEYTRLNETLRYRTEEMQSVVQETKRLSDYVTKNKRSKTRFCERCLKLESRNKNQESLTARLVSLARRLAQMVPQNHASYELCLRELDELTKVASQKEEIFASNGLMESACERDETAVVESLPMKRECHVDQVVKSESTKSTHQLEETVVYETPKAARQMLETDSNKADRGDQKLVDESTIVECTERANVVVSPVVERSRNNKRRLKCISTKKRNKLENEENSVIRDSDSEFPDFEVISYQSKSRAETPDVVDVKNCITPRDPLETPKAAEEPSQNSIDDIIEPTQKAPSRRVATRGRRSLVFGKPNLNDATIEQFPEKCVKTAPEKTSPLNIIITSSNSGPTYKSPSKCNKVKKTNEVEESVFKNPKAQADETKKKNNNNQDTKWNLAPSRQPTNSKLKQTLLTTTAVQKKTDITKQEKFNGGLLRSAETKKTVDENRPPNKVLDGSSLSPTFESAITSTVNEVVFKTPVKNEKADRFAKYANKVVDNSFDVIPKTSPKYKYQRDAVRKKCERRKLPGQDCDCCTEYYNGLAQDLGQTQANIMMDKYSRHRDKNPVKSNTPHGFWNPDFDSNDEMLVESRP